MNEASSAARSCAASDAHEVTINHGILYIYRDRCFCNSGRVTPLSLVLFDSISLCYLLVPSVELGVRRLSDPAMFFNQPPRQSVATAASIVFVAAGASFIAAEASEVCFDVLRRRSVIASSSSLP